jgi:hypothetical protein
MHGCGAGWMCTSHATASWTAVAEMRGASLHRRHRFREVLNALGPYLAVRPAKAASRQGLPHALQEAVAPFQAPFAQSQLTPAPVETVETVETSHRQAALPPAGCRLPSRESRVGNRQPRCSWPTPDTAQETAAGRSRWKTVAMRCRLMKWRKAMSTSKDGNQKGCLGCHGLWACLGDFHGPLDIGLIHTPAPVETVEIVEVSPSAQASIHTSPR